MYIADWIDTKYHIMQFEGMAALGMAKIHTNKRTASHPKVIKTYGQ